MADAAETLELEPRRHTGIGLALGVGIVLLLLGRVVLADPDGPVTRPVPVMPGPAAVPPPAAARGPAVTIAPQCVAGTSRPVPEACRRAVAHLLASLASPRPVRTCPIAADAAEHWVRSAGRLPGCRTGTG
jgi:hypothetical protein